MDEILSNIAATSLKISGCQGWMSFWIGREYRQSLLWASLTPSSRGGKVLLQETDKIGYRKI